MCIRDRLYIGPPGAGKTMMAKRGPTILPVLTKEESMEITKIYSVAGGLRHDSPMAVQRPYREVHHTVTRQALSGGGRIPSPGECTLAPVSYTHLYRHLKANATLAKSLGVPKDNVFIMQSGDVLALDDDGAEIVDKVHTGEILVDGQMCIRDRCYRSDS